MIIRSLRFTDCEFWEEEPGKLPQMLIGKGCREEAIQRNIRMEGGRRKVMDMPALLRNGSEATDNTMKMEHSYDPERKDKPVNQLFHTT
ncbi:unnamed protein product [Protopolystoma xenopodis]|uniref:Uncharacterized protein n=1 Tax=Protopolystoma xenopodis TaxID=117903 RepID=A0A448WHZ9_9PLAT|nr:unnamed protein product [Protopolystoma xenopodis]